MTHKDLVEIAYRWLLKNAGVGIAFKELKSIDREIPDAIGFGAWKSVLIECKVSRSDFLSDKKKPHRAKGMGNWRFYMCPRGLIKIDELPDKWGLIYVNENGKVKIEHDCRIKRIEIKCNSDRELMVYPSGFYHHTVTAKENRFDADPVAERRIMYTALRRLFIKGFEKHIYDKDYQRGVTANDIIQANTFQ